MPDPCRRRLFAAALATLTLWLSAAGAAEGESDPGVAPTAPPLLLAETYAGQVAVADYLVSEKFDGVRAYWDGRRLWTRGGHPIAAPAWFTEVLPPRPLDGELWLGRARFGELSGLVRRASPDHAAWREVRYLLFELPGGEGGFAQRAEGLKALAEKIGVTWIQPVRQWRVADHAALMRELETTIAAGGEGLMLHRADAPYVTGRDPALLKVKAWHDAEAVVVAHLPGKGELAGKLGALRVRTADGREFSLGSGFTDQQRRQPPPVGSTVSYRYRELTAAGLPRHASFWRIREAE